MYEREFIRFFLAPTIMNPVIHAEPEYFNGRLIAVRVFIVRTVRNLDVPVNIAHVQRTLARAVISMVHEYNDWPYERIRSTVTGTCNLPRRSCCDESKQWQQPSRAKEFGSGPSGSNGKNYSKPAH